MAYILKNTSGLINTRLTDAGRQKLSQGNFNISYFQIGDSEVSYSVIPNFNLTNFNIFEPSFNAQNIAGSPQSNKSNVKYPIYVDDIGGNTYGIPFMDSVIEPVYNTAAERGFFSGTQIGDTSTYNWSALTNNLYAINSNYIIQMNTLVGTNTIDLVYSGCNISPVRSFSVGDIITIYYDGNGVFDCSCTNYPTPTPTPSVTTTATPTPTINTSPTPTPSSTSLFPCASPTPTPTPSATFCLTPTPSNPCPQPAPPDCVIEISSCYSILTYKIVDVCLNTITLDRPTPDFSYLGSDCFARTIIYPGTFTEIYDSITPFRHWNDNVINFESVCYTDQFDVKVWNMNIPWSESPAGLDSSISNDYTKFGSVNYLGSKEYLGYASSSGQTDTDSTYYFNSFDEIVTLLPEEQKAIAIVHYTNQTVDLFYGEKFALQPFDDSVADTTGQARNFKVHIPWIMWHKNPQCCLGQTFWVDPPGFEDLNLFEVHYLKSTKNVDMNDPGIRYFHLWDNNPNVNALIPNTPNRVGKVFPDLKIVVFDDEEIIAAMSYKSNRNWTLPAPKVSLITPNICGLDNSSVEGILTGSSEYLYVTYRLSNNLAFTNSLHCNYYQLVQGPNITCNPISSQNVSVRFGDEFPCLAEGSSSILPCWHSGFTFWLNVDPIDPDSFLAYPFRNTTETSNGLPIFFSYLPDGSVYNIYWDGVDWILKFGSSDENIILNFSGNSIIGDFSFSAFEGDFSGYTECAYDPGLCVTICEENVGCNQTTFNKYVSGGTELYLESGLGLDPIITFGVSGWELFSGGTSIATLTGSTYDDIAIGTWTTNISSVTAVTSVEFFDCVTFECEGFSGETSSVGESVIQVINCNFVIGEPQTGTTFSGCAITINGSFDVGINEISGTTSVSAITGDCGSVIDLTSTTICSEACLITEGFIADTFQIICQKVVGNGRPEPTEWKIIDFTDQLSGSTISGFLTQSGLTGNTFVITQDLYDNADTYVLTDYIDLPSGTASTSLNFGDEYYFYGNIETDIQATIYEMRYKINLGQSEFLASSNPTWDSTKKVHVSEIGLYDSDKTLMIISKLQSPYPRNGLQQFVVKFDL